jgi:hypothetical protein
MTSVQDYELKKLFDYVTQALEDLGIPYMVVGGFAAIFYGEPRMTIDIDIVVDMERKHVEPLVQTFAFPDFYISREGVLDALRRRYPFNIIQSSTGAKIDMMPLPRDVYSRIAFRRRKRLSIDESGRSAFFITPEDIVIAKLLAFRTTGSDKHLRDARGVLQIQWDYLDFVVLRKTADAEDVGNLLETLEQSIQEDQNF